MKKMKKLFLMSVLAVSSLAIMGMNEVKAAAFNMSNMDVICAPESLSPGGYAECYLIGKVQESTGSVNGYVTQVYTTDDLLLAGISANKSVTNASATLIEGKDSATISTITYTTDMPASLKDFKCEFDSAIVKSGSKKSEFGCGIFYTKTSAASNAYTPTTIIKKDTATNKALGSGKTSFGVIGSYKVQLSVDNKDNTCGDLCVKAWRVPEKTDYQHYQACAAGTTGPNGEKCSETTTAQNSTVVCDDIAKSSSTTYPGVNPPTGAFASYALLAAGALIAISAIAISKKHKKIYRV